MISCLRNKIRVTGPYQSLCHVIVLFCLSSLVITPLGREQLTLIKLIKQFSIECPLFMVSSGASMDTSPPDHSPFLVLARPPDNSTTVICHDSNSGQQEVI